MYPWISVSVTEALQSGLATRRDIFVGNLLVIAYKMDKKTKGEQLLEMEIL